MSQLFNTASLSYILPTHRATVYIMGILLGYYLHYYASVPLKLSKVGEIEIILSFNRNPLMYCGEW